MALTGAERETYRIAREQLAVKIAEARGRVQGYEEALALIESALAADAVDPQVGSTGNPTTRDASVQSGEPDRS